MFNLNVKLISKFMLILKGLRHGPATYFHPNGNKEEATYVEGYEEVLSRSLKMMTKMVTMISMMMTMLLIVMMMMMMIMIMIATYVEGYEEVLVLSLMS